jgi:hypothetical protein
MNPKVTGVVVACTFRNLTVVNVATRHSVDPHVCAA